MRLAEPSSPHFCSDCDMRLTALLLLAAAAPLVRAVSSPKLPKNVPRCKRNDPNISDCLGKIFRQAMAEIKGGIPSLGLPSFDPLYVTSIEIKQGDGPISINLKFTNITAFGFGNPMIQAIHANLNNYSLIFDGTIPKIVFESDYEMTGRMLLLPATGKGRCKMTFTDLEGTLGPKGKGIQKKGKTYFDVTNFYVKLHDLKGLHFQFDNLFNGDKVLGSTLNRLMNENWKELWMELQSALVGTFKAIFSQYTKTLFGKVAFNDIFID